MSAFLSDDARQAATPKHNVRVRAVASRNIDRNWLTPILLDAAHRRATTECRFGKCRHADVMQIFPRL